MNMKRSGLIFPVLFSLLSSPSFATGVASELDRPIIVLGASYSSAAFPFDDNLSAPLGGVAVNLGRYLSFGNALTRDPRLPGYVINEANAGATTFDRPSCNPGPGCNFGHWQGLDKQVTKALARVTIPGTNISMAKYAVITSVNDCLHSDSFGIPQDQTRPCTMDEINAYIDRLIAAGQRLLNAGVTPIFDVYADYKRLDWPAAAAAAGLLWVADESYYNLLRETHRTRLTNELPGAVVMDMWKGVTTEDGGHPDDRSMVRASQRVVQYIINNSAAK